jgi:PII-like signaling protein
MQGSFLRLYVHEGQRHRGRPAWEWLLEQANKLGIRGGSAFRAMAGFGRHHKLSEAKFFELAGSLAVEVEFIVTEGEAQQLFNLIHHEKIPLFYAKQVGLIPPDRWLRTPARIDRPLYEAHLIAILRINFAF